MTVVVQVVLTRRTSDRCGTVDINEKDLRNVFKSLD